MTTPTAEDIRLRESRERTKNWKRWGPYLAERQWGTVREDYSPDGSSWGYFPHEHARSRAYRWGEDGLLGICDRQCRLCFALALWNGRDPLLKERLYGLTGPQGNHGEDVKECYYYLDSTPTHSYFKGLYKYPQAEFPYARLREENARRNRSDREFELSDCGVYDAHRYFDVLAEYAKAAPDDILVRVTVSNRGPERAVLHLLPTLWFRNTWSWECTHEGCEPRPRIAREASGAFVASHRTLGRFRLAGEQGPRGDNPELLLTENDTNVARLFGVNGEAGATKDAFHAYVIEGDQRRLAPGATGTKAAFHYVLAIEAGSSVTLRFRLSSESDRAGAPFGDGFEEVFAQRIREADEFYASRLPDTLSADERRVARQAHAGLLWSKQFYHYVVKNWLEGDPGQPPPPRERLEGRNADWHHLFNRDVISMPDKWEYPWYAAWDLAFHMIPFARTDPDFAKSQLVLLLREWYMHPNGQLPAYEWQFSDVNPPVHAWAAWRVYKIAAPRGERDRLFLARVFKKLLINFTWWVNRKDIHGKHIFSGGFLGLDNIGVFDRSKPFPTGGNLEQADGTAWMAFYAATMLAMALELARHDPAYEDVASKFFEHFVAIADAMNTLDGSGLWDENDGFYYDHLRTREGTIPLRVRSMVGLIPLFAAEVLEAEVIEQLPGFKKRMEWFLENRQDLAQQISCTNVQHDGGGERTHRLLAIPSRDRLERVLRYVFDENEFLSPFGIRSLSRVHERAPFTFDAGGETHSVRYAPGESPIGIFGGNSNWRGPIWLPLNFLLIECLQRYHYFYGDSLRVECPTGSGRLLDLREAAGELAARLVQIFTADADGRRPCHGKESRYADDPWWRELVLFHEYFHGETGEGLGASHQTGWTALVATLLEHLHRDQMRPSAISRVRSNVVMMPTSRPSSTTGTR